MPTWDEEFGKALNANNSNYTDQSQSNPTAVAGGGVHSVDVHNDQSNATFQQADAGSGGYHFARLPLFRRCEQLQRDPSIPEQPSPSSSAITSVRSTCTTARATRPTSRPTPAPVAMVCTAPMRTTTTSRPSPRTTRPSSAAAVAASVMSTCTIDQSNATFQQADAGSGGHGFPSFAGASNFNFTTQVQADPTIVIGDHIGSVDVHNSQSNATEQLALAHH